MTNAGSNGLNIKRLGRDRLIRNCERFHGNHDGGHRDVDLSPMLPTPLAAASTLDSGTTILQPGSTNGATPQGSGTITLGAAGNASASLNIVTTGNGNTLAPNLTVASGNTGTLSLNLSGAAHANFGSSTSTITLNSNLVLNASNSSSDNLEGILTGAGNLYVYDTSSTGAVALNGTTMTNYTGTVFIEQGTVQDSQNTFKGTVAFGSTGTLAVQNTTGQIGGLESVATGYGTVAGGATNDVFTLVGTGTYNFSGVIENTLPGTSDSIALNIALGTGGIQTFSGANTYTGATTLTSGTLDLGSSGALGQTSAFTWKGGTLDNTSGSPITQGSNPVVTLGSGDTFTFGGSNNLNLGTGGGTFSAPTFVLNGTNSVLTLGGTYVNGGATSNFTVNGAGNTLVLGGVALSNNGTSDTLTFKGSGNTEITGAVTDSSSTATASAVTYNGTGTLVLAGTNTYHGATTIAAGTVQLGNDGTTGSLSTSSTITDNGTFIIDRSNAVAQGTDFTSSAISGSGGLTQAGTGATTLSSANTYNGPTQVNAGALIVTNGSGSATGNGALSVAGGATLAGTGTAGTTTVAAFSIKGGSTSNRATVLVGQNAATANTDLNTSSNLTLLSSGTATIADANLVFNLNAKVAGGSGYGGTNAGASNELAVGKTNISFDTGIASVQLTLNIQQEPAIIAPFTPYVLIAGTGTTSTGIGTSTGQFAGLTLEGSLASAPGTTTTLISTTDSNFLLNFAGETDSAFYGKNSYLVLYQASGIDDIDVVVVPEPGELGHDSWGPGRSAHTAAAQIALLSPPRWTAKPS